MNARSFWFLCIVAVFTNATPAQQDNHPPTGFEPLFNGENLDGWVGQRNINPYELAELSADEINKMRSEDRRNMQQHWRVENGEIINDGSGVYLATEREFGDFELLIDYQTVAGADSGIYLKACPQVQIWDYTEAGGKWNIGADKGSGGLWNNRPGSPGKDPLVLADHPFGQWNRFRIRQIGQRTSIWLNDKLVVDHAIMENNHWKKGHPLPPRGPIWLQTHGGEIRWKNIFVRDIPVAEANTILAKQDAEGFKSIFNGTNLDGWTGPIENYEVVDGAIQCKAGKGGTIYTDDRYGDFTVQFEFKLPPGGNNGLAIRYPGQGDTAYSGMCELQVLDNTADQYSQLDPRQYHGSAYGMVAAHRGYLREPGEWNFQRVTVVGPTIQVELNGTLILDADLSQITEYMNDSPHPGKNRTEGHFGFAGHGDPVAFRDVRIRRIEP